MFQPKSLFEASLKIIGVLTIIWSFTHIPPVIYKFVSVNNMSEMMANNDLTDYRFSLIFQVVYPVILFIIGVYLLVGAKALVRFAFHDLRSESDDNIRLLFGLFMKLGGLVLIIYALPKAFQIISSIMYLSSVSGLGMGEQTQYIAGNLVPTIIHLLLGLYLLRSGRIFYKLGFAKNSETG